MTDTLCSVGPIWNVWLAAFHEELAKQLRLEERATEAMLQITMTGEGSGSKP